MKPLGSSRNTLLRTTMPSGRTKNGTSRAPAGKSHNHGAYGLRLIPASPEAASRRLEIEIEFGADRQSLLVAAVRRPIDDDLLVAELRDDPLLRPEIGAERDH